MAVSKRLRFEVFKRDLFQCQYCGRTPPAVVLEVDHINPQKQGRNDSIDNLITSCFDCNRGKAAIPLSEAPEALSDKLAVMNEKRTQLKAFDRFLKHQEQRTLAQINEVQGVFSTYYPGFSLCNRFCDSTLRRFLAGLSTADLRMALAIAAAKYPQTDDREQAIHYFCGICWNRIKERGLHV